MKFFNRTITSLILALSLNCFAAVQAVKYTVQLGAAQTREEAEKKVNQFKTQGIEAYIIKSQVPGTGGDDSSGCRRISIARQIRAAAGEERTTSKRAAQVNRKNRASIER